MSRVHRTIVLLPARRYRGIAFSQDGSSAQWTLLFRIIDHLGKVVNKIAEKKDVNRMGLPNLAIVFAPSFLKSPSGSVLVQMENTQYEARCVRLFFRAACLEFAQPVEKKPIAFSALHGRLWKGRGIHFMSFMGQTSHVSTPSAFSA